MNRKKRVETITKVVTNQECQNHRQALSQMKRIRWDFNPKSRSQQTFWDNIDSNGALPLVPHDCNKDE